MNAPVRMVLCIASLATATLLTGGSALAQGAVQITGTVTVNDGPAPASLTITLVSSEGDDCGTTPTGDGGSISLELDVECLPGETVQFFLGDGETGLLSVPPGAIRPMSHRART